LATTTRRAPCSMCACCGWLSPCGRLTDVDCHGAQQVRVVLASQPLRRPTHHRTWTRLQRPSSTCNTRRATQVGARGGGGWSSQAAVCGATSCVLRTAQPTIACAAVLAPPPRALAQQPRCTRWLSRQTLSRGCCASSSSRAWARRWVGGTAAAHPVCGARRPNMQQGWCQGIEAPMLLLLPTLLRSSCRTCAPTGGVAGGAAPGAEGGLRARACGV
jgi:hypothetical protein